MKLPVVNLSSDSVGEVTLSDSVFGVEVRRDVLQRMVEWQRAKKQAGTHKTKTISEIRGTTAKPFRQKGTGRARQGSRRASQMVGGQTVFGPVVRSHAHKLTKKFRILGLRTALSSKAADSNIMILDSTKADSLKASGFAKAMKGMGWEKPLIVDVDFSDNFLLSARNIKHVDVLPVQGINVVDILKHKELVLTKAALEALEGRLA